MIATTEPQKSETPLAGGASSATTTKHNPNLSAPDTERKSYATQQARAASYGFIVTTANGANGERVILASPWGQCRVFKTVRELATFVDSLGGAP